MECAKKVSQDIEQFMNEAGLNEAFLFGGAVLDPLVKKDCKISDYDLCVRDKDVFYEALKQLDANDIPISEVMRTHNIYVVIKHPHLGQIDFSCMDPEANGIFNIEKIYARFRKINGEKYTNTIVDKYNAVESFKQGRIHLACDVENEGAYNILRRFLAIVGKYNLDISRGGVNQKAIDDMNKQFNNAHHYIPQDKVRCLARLSASLRRSKNRQEFVKNIGRQRILAQAFPEIDKLFNDKNFQTSEQLDTCQTQKELLELMLSKTRGQDRDDLIDCLQILKHRETARQDKGVKDFVEQIEKEKTSPERLCQNILNPVFAYIYATKGKTAK